MAASETLPLTRQTWRNLVALHWRVPDDALRPLVPPELELLLVDGHWWVTLSGFKVTEAQFGPSVPLPSFSQIELRTPVRDRSGRIGTWYLSVDTTSAALAAEARIAFGMPYATATIVLESHDGEDPMVSLTARRASADPVSCTIVVQASGASPAGISEEVSRALLFPERTWTRGGEGLKRIEVSRGDARVLSARLERIDETWLWSAGLKNPGQVPTAHMVLEQRVEIHAPVVER